MLTDAGSEVPPLFDAEIITVPEYVLSGSPLITRVREPITFVSPAGIVSGVVVHVTGTELSAVMINGAIMPPPKAPVILDVSGLNVGFVIVLGVGDGEGVTEAESIAMLTVAGSETPFRFCAVTVTTPE